MSKTNRAAFTADKPQATFEPFGKALGFGDAIEAMPLQQHPSRPLEVLEELIESLR
jgi:hypothetical protein